MKVKMCLDMDLGQMVDWQMVDNGMDMIMERNIGMDVKSFRGVSFGRSDEIIT